VQDGHVLVSTPAALAAKPYRTRVTVADLTNGNAQQLAALTELIQSLAAPGSWTPPHPGRIEALGDELFVDQNYRGHQAVATLLAKLRAARAQSLLAAGADRSALATRYARAKPKLAKTIKLVYAVPTPLTKILRRLEQETQTTILIDWRALALEGVGDGAEATLVATDKPLEEVLAALVEPLDLACRVINDRTLEVTSAERVEGELEIEAYPIGDLAPTSVTAESLVAGLRKQLGEDRYREAGGAGVLHYDAPSRTLIVLDNQNGQISLEKALDVQRLRLQKKP
jgi:hypothetical protein